MVCRSILSTFFCLFVFTGNAQKVLDLNPELGKLVDLDPEKALVWQAHQSKCEELWSRLPTYYKEEDLSESDRLLLSGCTEEFESYWDVIGIGCSWYCGGGQDSLSASSELYSKSARYKAQNAHDLSYETAWVEGVTGNGVGEKLTYHVKATNPRITELIVVNGYVTSLQTWQDNGRVKKLRMYIDDKPYATLNLADSRQEQHFKVEPIGLRKLHAYEELEKMPDWRMTFEILEVYPGDKYEDTAITEIYFDGIDVH